MLLPHVCLSLVMARASNEEGQGVVLGEKTETPLSFQIGEKCQNSRLTFLTVAWLHFSDTNGACRRVMWAILRWLQNVSCNTRKR